VSLHEIRLFPQFGSHGTLPYENSATCEQIGSGGTIQSVQEIKYVATNIPLLLPANHIAQITDADTKTNLALTSAKDCMAKILL